MDHGRLRITRRLEAASLPARGASREIPGIADEDRTAPEVRMSMSVCGAGCGERMFARPVQMKAGLARAPTSTGRLSRLQRGDFSSVRLSSVVLTACADDRSASELQFVDAPGDGVHAPWPPGAARHPLAYLSTFRRFRLKLAFKTESEWCAL